MVKNLWRNKIFIEEMLKDRMGFPENGGTCSQNQAEGGHKESAR